jgi:chromosome segregation ATPase
MADTPQAGETVTPTAPSNEPGTTTTPPVVTSSADVEQAKRDAEAQRLRANQLQNELDKAKQAQDEAQRKQLEEKEEFKTLYEKTQAQLNEITAAQENATRQTQLASETETLLKDYPTEVAKIAKTAGLVLSDDSDASKAALKVKLDELKSTVSPGTIVTSNNPSNPSEPQLTREQLVTKGEDGVSPMAWAGAKGDESVSRKFAASLNAVKEMKRMAGQKVD